MTRQLIGAQLTNSLLPAPNPQPQRPAFNPPSLSELVFQENLTPHPYKLIFQPHLSLQVSRLIIQQ